jgi:hypothetical protein
VTGIEWTPGVLDEIARSPEMRALLSRAAGKVRAEAEENARAAFPDTDRASAHGVYSGVDEYGAYADVGYTRRYYGFVLWWSEVGTATTPARPMLRQALQQVRL